MSTLDKLKKVALTGHSVTLAPQSVIEIADLLGEVKTSYANAHEQIKDLESKLAAAHDVRDSWKRRAWDAEEALASITSDVEAINNALGDHEWAEHCTTTQQGQTLEGFITALVGEVTELREKVKQPVAAAEFKPVALPEPYDDGDGNHWLCRAAVIRAIHAAGGSIEE